MVGQEKECLVDDVLQFVTRLEDIVAGRVIPARHHRQQPVEKSETKFDLSHLRHSKLPVTVDSMLVKCQYTPYRLEIHILGSFYYTG